MQRIHYVKYSPRESVPPASANGLSRSFNLIHSYHQPCVQPHKQNTPVMRTPHDTAHLCRAFRCREHEVGNTKESWWRVAERETQRERKKREREIFLLETYWLQICGYFCLHFLFMALEKKKTSHCAFINVAAQR